MINLLSNPSKMPCYSFNIPAFKYCPAAQLLAKIKEAGKKFICDSCYACKGFYMFSNVKASLQGKADLITKSLHQDNAQSILTSTETKSNSKRQTQICFAFMIQAICFPLSILPRGLRFVSNSQQFVFGFQPVNGSATRNFHTCKS